MEKNSQYMRSVNDYSLSAHELFTGESGQSHPSDTRVFVMKNFSSIDEINSIKEEIKQAIRSNTEQLVCEQSYRISYRDTLIEEMDDYTIYGQEFLVRSAIPTTDPYGIVVQGGTLVAEMYRRAEELILILLGNKNLDWMDKVYEDIQSRFPEKEEDLANTFFTIGRSPNGSFELQNMELQTVYDENIINTNYNDSFRETWELTLKAIDENESGLILLHGDAGAGKSNVLKQIIARGGTRKIVFIPSYLATSLSDPSFIGFVRKNMTGSVLVIEDGEDVLISREIASNPAVSNLLQISDGILGDALNILIISTFNTDLARIDGALQRKGRMIAEYKFRELNKEKAEALVVSLFGENHGLVMPKELTLANLFTLDKHQPKTTIVKPKVGF